MNDIIFSLSKSPDGQIEIIDDIKEDDITLCAALLFRHCIVEAYLGKTTFIELIESVIACLYSIDDEALDDNIARLSKMARSIDAKSLLTKK